MNVCLCINGDAWSCFFSFNFPIIERTKCLSLCFMRQVRIAFYILTQDMELNGGGTHGTREVYVDGRTLQN